MSFFFQKSTWGAAKKSKASAPTSAAAFNANAAVSASASATATATALPTGPAFDWAAFAARAVAELPDDYARRFCKNFEDKSAEDQATQIIAALRDLTQQHTALKHFHEATMARGGASARNCGHSAVAESVASSGSSLAKRTNSQRVSFEASASAAASTVDSCVGCGEEPSMFRKTNTCGGCRGTVCKSCSTRVCQSCISNWTILQHRHRIESVPASFVAASAAVTAWSFPSSVSSSSSSSSSSSPSAYSSAYQVSTSRSLASTQTAAQSSSSSSTCRVMGVGGPAIPIGPNGSNPAFPSTLLAMLQQSNGSRSSSPASSPNWQTKTGSALPTSFSSASSSSSSPHAAAASPSSVSTAASSSTTMPPPPVAIAATLPPQGAIRVPASAAAVSASARPPLPFLASIRSAAVSAAVAVEAPAASTTATVSTMSTSSAAETIAVAAAAARRVGPIAISSAPPPGAIAALVAAISTTATTASAAPSAAAGVASAVPPAAAFQALKAALSCVLTQKSAPAAQQSAAAAAVSKAPELPARSFLAELRSAFQPVPASSSTSFSSSSASASGVSAHDAVVMTASASGGAASITSPSSLSSLRPVTRALHRALVASGGATPRKGAEADADADEPPRKRPMRASMPATPKTPVGDASIMSELKLSLSARRRAIACSTSPRSNRPKRGAAALSSSAAGQKPLAQSRSSDSFACFEEETNEDTENECVNTASITVAATAAAKQPLAAKPNPSHRRTFAAAHAASKAVAATASISTAARSADPQRTEKFPLMASTALSAHLTARDNCSLRRAAIASPERPANEWQD